MAGFIFSGGGAASTGFTSTGSTTSRTFAARGADIKNVKDFGAVGDNSTDDTAAINAAIAAASGSGAGGIVFFPAGNYVVTGSLFNNTTGYCSLIGSGKRNTAIQSGFAGFTIDQNGGEHGGRTVGGQIELIADMTVNNTYVSSGFDPTVGAIRQNIPAASCVIRNCNISGWNGILATGNSFNGLIEGCEINGGGLPGTIGICAANWSVTSTAVAAYWYGMAICGTGGASLVGCRVESCSYGVVFGLDETNSNRPCNGGAILGLTTERCNVGVYVQNGAQLSLGAMDITGTLGAPYGNISTISWSGGTATVTLSGLTTDSVGWTAGTQTITISQNTNTGGNGPWDLGNVFVTGTRTGTNTFTYPLAVDPGAYPGLNSFDAQWSFKQTSGLQLRVASQVHVHGSTVNVQTANLSGAAIDLYVDGANSGTNNVLAGVIGGNWNMPPSTSKANYAYVNCNNPGGTTVDARGVQSGMVFADLPGQASVVETTPRQGMMYYITNGNQATIGGNVTGAGANQSYVVWNGSNWVRGAA